MPEVAVGEQWEVKFVGQLGTIAWTTLMGQYVADGEGNLQPFKKNQNVVFFTGYSELFSWHGLTDSLFCLIQLK